MAKAAVRIYGQSNVNDFKNKVDMKMAEGGKFAFLPWLTVPEPVQVGGFRFMQVDTRCPEHIVGAEIAEIAKLIFSRYIDIRGNPIQTCTVALRPRHPRSWDIPENHWHKLFEAASCLALVCLAEQRFFEQLSPHLNATLFRPIIQGVVPGQDGITLDVRRRDGRLTAGGFSFRDVVFQMPLEAFETECPKPSQRFARALNRARTSNTGTWAAIRESLPFFLLGHSEAREMPHETCALLSALAFERLFTSAENRPKNANDVAKEFNQLWSSYTSRIVANSRKVTIDPHPKYGPVQNTWPIHRKWMKELYEARSEHAHGSANATRSSNWQPWQHVLLAAFCYPLCVKLILSAEKLYELDAREVGACEALDKLLDSDWGSGSKRVEEWPTILSMSEEWRTLSETVEQAFKNANLNSSDHNAQ